MSEVSPDDITIIAHRDPPFLPDGRVVPATHGWDWISSGWKMFLKEPVIWMVIGVLFIVFFAVLHVVPVIGGIAATVLAPVLIAGIMLGCHDQQLGQPLEIRHLIAGFSRNTSALIVLGVVMLIGLIIAAIPSMLVVGFAGAMAFMTGNVTAILGLGLLATVLAAALYLALSLPVYMAAWYAPLLIVLHGMTVTQALKASFIACLKNFIPFLVYGLVLLVVGTLASIPFGLGLLVLMPVCLASVYTSYRDIFFAA